MKKRELVAKMQSVDNTLGRDCALFYDGEMESQNRWEMLLWQHCAQISHDTIYVKP